MVTTFVHLSLSDWSSASPMAGSGNTMISLTTFFSIYGHRPLCVKLV